MDKLSIGYDPGTSLTKILYQVGDSQIKYLTMFPEIVPISASSVQGSASSRVGKPEDKAWVRLTKKGEYLAVGQLARNHRATVSMKNLKYEWLVPKILAAVGAIATKEGLTKSFELELGILLPYSEYPNREELETDLTKSLKGFFFQQHYYQVKLNRCVCLPEGLGLVYSTINQTGVKRFQNQTLACLMFGYRNTSLLLFQNGTLSKERSSTSKLGFYNLIDQITAKVSGLEREEVQSSIMTVSRREYDWDKVAWNQEVVTNFAVEDLIKSRSTDKSEKEKAAIASAIETGTWQYWKLLEAWLYESLPPLRQLDSVICCGGALAFLRTHLEGDLKGVDLYYPEKEQQQLVTALSLDEYEQEKFQQQNLALRFVDVWGMFIQTFNYNISSQSNVIESAA